MSFRRKITISKTNSPGSRTRSYLRHTPLVTSGLVALAILSGVLFYVQAGLLFYKPPHTSNVGQTIQLDETHEPSPTKQPVLDAQDTVKPPKPTQPEPRAASGGVPKKPSTACNENAQDRARQAYQRALAAEETLHKKIVSGSRLSKTLHTLSFGLTGDKTETENARHEAVVNSLKSKYHQALAAAHCLG